MLATMVVPAPCTCGRNRIVGDLEDRNAALEQRAGSRHVKSEYRRAKDENKVVGAEPLGQWLRRSRQEARKQRVILGKPARLENGAVAERAAIAVHSGCSLAL